MDDQNNQNQPGQSYQPPQQVPPQTPQQAYPQQQQYPQQPYPNQQYPQQQAPQPQPQYPQQQYPQQPVVQDYPPSQSPNQQIEQLVDSSSLNIKKIGIFAGIFLLGSAIITILASLLGGSGSALPLVTIEDEQLTFSVALPEGWNANVSAVSNFNVVNASPADEIDGDDTAVAVSHTITPKEKEIFVTETGNEVDNLASRDFQTTFNVGIDQLSLEPLSDDDTSFKISYLQTNQDTMIEHIVERYFFYQADGTVISARFAYSQNYPDVAGSIQAILDSYKIK